MTLSPFLIRLANRLVAWRSLLFVSLLALLHLVIVLGASDPLAKTVFVVQLGLFILWQPFVRSDQRLSPLALILLALLIGVVAFWLSEWALVVWVTLLGGIVGGKVLLFESRGAKYFYLLALAYLVAALLFMVVPAAVPGEINPRNPATLLGQWVLPFIFPAMLLIPRHEESDNQPEVIDFLYSVLMVLLLGVLVLGSLALMMLWNRTYVQSLIEILLIIGVVLLVLGWIWHPHGGMVGVSTILSRYLLSIGLPMEQWLHTLADFAHGEADPESFVAASCDEMVRRLSWVTGVSWSTQAAHGSAGKLTGRSSEFRFDNLELAIYTRYQMTSSLRWHFNLLAQLIAEFHADKQRSRQLERLSYVQAVYETGARLTHDTKNILQVLRTLCTAVEQQGEEVSPEFVALMRRQLPAVAFRLEQTLDKLQAPQADSQERTALPAWWDELRRRYASMQIGFVTKGDLPPGATIPVVLFDHVAENLLANSLAKTSTDGAIPIRVVLNWTSAGAELEVQDGGAEIPAALAAKLLQGPVPSERGLGIGLYQSARLAAQGGYGLALAINEPGNVSFRLAPAPA
jgi:signal transduction histidine kinase